LKDLNTFMVFMNTEIALIVEQLKDVYDGDPWYGKSIVTILTQVNEQNAFEKPVGQHSIIEILWHMINWREFTISRIRRDENKDVHSFEQSDWIQLDHSDKSLWLKGIYRLQQAQNDLIELLKNTDDELLEKTVSGRQYFFRKLLFGIIHHDIYHLGQIAYINKLLKGE
jgi:uncharacterized damage-inducible protein DinB